ncbi:MAG: PorT family protein [Bacteroidia bacterium]|nr:PorT family protein [Bacteroidia bacterium]
MSDWQNQDKVTGKLRDKVYNHSETPSDALWEKLDARLNALAAPERKRRVGWYWIAAIIAGMTAGLWAAIHFIDEKDAVPAKVQITAAPPKAENEVPKLTPELLQTSPEKTKILVAGKAHKEIKKNRKYSEKKIAEKNKVMPAQPETTLVPGQPEEPSEVITTKETKELTPAQLTENISKPQLTIGDPIVISFKEIKFPDFPLHGNTKLLPPPVERERCFTPVSAFSIAIVNNVSYGITRYSPGSNANAARLDNAKLTNQISNGRVAPSFGLSAGLRITDRLMLSAGFRRTIYSDKYTYDIKKAVSDPYKGTDPTLLAFNYKHGGDSIMPGSTYSFINKFYCSEVPITFSYYVPMNKRWNVVLDAGVSFMKVTYASAAYLDIDRVGFVVVQSLTEYPGYKMVTNLNLGMGMSYRLNGKFSVEASPYLRYGLNSIIKDNSFTRQSPAFFGLNATLRYHAF